MTTKDKVKHEILRCGFVPIIRTDNPEAAVRVAGAIRDGGAPLLEITMTVPGALHIIKEIVDAFGDTVLVGAGTILDSETARMAILAGAEFIVAPTLDVATIRLCHRYSKIIMPGALTPSEILQAWEMGADFVKVFPADAMGGAAYIKAVKAPLPQVDMIPTGGVDIDTAADFIRAGASAVGVGSALIDRQFVAAEAWDRLSQKTEDFLKTISAARIG
ncbi:MAG: bifunctional 4-hydroxy-2-oxoglutarate aldolase/2-dehydro-3-deoxy-phosphogluconate aldolase [Desulfobacterales bacterium]|nr:MAG: bifunctional 4-hydroxy-2-oxoglutarate aldolase/2-dehydro-3-deoxy-phosphogluconate aldolase [Desulfobacterales bacterium]